MVGRVAHSVAKRRDPTRTVTTWVRRRAAPGTVSSPKVNTTPTALGSRGEERPQLVVAREVVMTQGPSRAALAARGAAHRGQRRAVLARGLRVGQGQHLEEVVEVHAAGAEARVVAAPS